MPKLVVAKFTYTWTRVLPEIETNSSLMLPSSWYLKFKDNLGTSGNLGWFWKGEKHETESRYRCAVLEWVTQITFISSSFFWSALGSPSVSGHFPAGGGGLVLESCSGTLYFIADMDFIISLIWAKIMSKLAPGGRKSPSNSHLEWYRACSDTKTDTET